MSRGFDATANCAALAGVISIEHYDFVCRYFGHTVSKCLTAGEARQISQAGLNLVTVWEDNPTYDGYFSHTKGVDDGTSAYQAAISIGQPEGSAVYFAVDYDAEPAVISNVIADYFSGIRDGFAACGAGKSPLYSVGIYGSGAACRAIINLNLAGFAWLAQSTGWADSLVFADWNIKQNSGATLFGIGVDLDEATDNYGGFKVPL